MIISIIGIFLMLLSLCAVISTEIIDYFVEKYTGKVINDYSEFLIIIGTGGIILGALLALLGFPIAIVFGI